MTSPTILLQLIFEVLLRLIKRDSALGQVAVDLLLDGGTSRGPRGT